MKTQEWANSLPLDKWLFDFGPFDMPPKPDAIEETA
jgi:hypothetical protein